MLVGGHRSYKRFYVDRAVCPSFLANQMGTSDERVDGRSCPD
jgi:hypothetical protein